MRRPRPDFSEGPLISPRESVWKRARRVGLKRQALRLPKSFLLSLNVGATPLLVEETGAQEASWIYGARPLYTGKVVGTPVGVIWAAPGAPLATVVMEDLVACGVKEFVGVGSAGAIQPFIDVGDCIVPSSAVRDEGTSYHYLPPAEEALPDQRVARVIAESCRELGVTPHVGPVWTTDAPYRETASKIAFFQRRGVLGVDMETSALFSLGRYRRVKVGCILAALDNLTRPRTSVGPFYSKESRDTMLRTVRISLRTVQKLGGLG